MQKLQGTKQVQYVHFSENQRGSFSIFYTLLIRMYNLQFIIHDSQSHVKVK